MKKLILIISMAATALLAQSPIPSTFFGQGVRFPMNYYPQLPASLLRLGNLGMWTMIEPQRGVYNWIALDTYVAQAMANGAGDTTTNTANILVTIGMTPQWAVAPGAASGCKAVSPGDEKMYCPAPPANLQDWTDFITALVSRYNGTAHPHIHYYELWNEANLRLRWTGTTLQLLQLAKAAYPILHADTHSLVLTPSAAPSLTPTAWMTSYMTTVAGDGVTVPAAVTDVGSMHVYLGNGTIWPFPWPEQDSVVQCTGNKAQFCFGSVITQVTAMRAVFDANGMSGKPMIMSEGGWGNGGWVDTDIEVAWLARYYLLLAGYYNAANLQAVAWYQIGTAGSADNWGIIENGDHTPTAAGVAYQQVYNWLVGATIAAPCSATGTVWSCALTRPNGYSGLAVWDAGAAPSTYTPASNFTQYRDLTGATTAVATGTTVSIGSKPILLETGTPQ
jgi:hypothetical protein